MHMARILRDFGREKTEQGRFSGTGFADHGQNLALMQFEGDAVAGNVRAIAFGKAVGRQKRNIHCVASEAKGVVPSIAPR
jgi:hypothetical protein